MLVCVIIPIYKKYNELLPYEITALHQGIEILSNHDIWLVAPEDFHVNDYLEIGSKYHVKFNFKSFPNHYFNDINGYNKLLKKLEFFECFSRYNYMLIYQLDAYVFKDELIEWCHKEFDFIGAPWVKGWQNTDSKDIIGVGNGGFSLHNISSSIKVLSSLKVFYRMLNTTHEIIGDELYLNFRRFLKYKFLKLFIGEKASQAIFLLDVNDGNINEDFFWGELVPSVFKKFKVASVEEAIKFSFEVNPRYLYTLNENRLPFGCHAWMKYDTDFWEPFIYKEK